jgi:hypothetical protein
MLIAIRLAVSFVLLMSGAWAALPGGFGVSNFRGVHAGALGYLALLCWWLLLLAHPLAIYRIWIGDNLWLWLGLIAAMQLLFFISFGSDVSTG